MQFSRRHFISLLFTLAMGCTFTVAHADDTANPASPAASTGPKVTLKTNMGDIVLELYPDKAPKTVDNFLRYVKEGYYKGTIFHRVIDGFMIQGGGYDKTMAAKPTHAPIQNEANNGLKNDTYTIAMARTDNPNSATSQFFINVNNNDSLNYPAPDGAGYCVFGKVISGMETVDKIKLVKTENKNGTPNVPVTPVIIKSATITK